MESICAGLNVLELGSGSVAASIAGVVLADAGARVIKIEPPDGDRLRTHNPSGFLVWNRARRAWSPTCVRPKASRSFATWPCTPTWSSRVSRPARHRVGIGADDLRAANPSLIHCAITGFGTTGPYSRLKAYDSLIAAKAGCGRVARSGIATVRSCSLCPGRVLAPVCSRPQAFWVRCLFARRPVGARRCSQPCSPVWIRSTTSLPQWCRSWPNAARSRAATPVQRRRQADSVCCS